MNNQTQTPTLPKIACLTITHNRPHLLPNLIESFLRQDYPAMNRELLILDDLGQYPTEPSGDGWQVISVKRRFETLSAKRNALAAMTGNDVDALAWWDDDDTFLPWCLLSHAWALKRSPVSHPGLVLDGSFKVHETGQRMYQATQCIDRELFFHVGGYPRGNSGVDQHLITRLRKIGSLNDFADPTEQFPPWFIYGWSDTNSPHLSTLDKPTGYDGERLTLEAEMGRKNQVSEIVPKWRRNWSVEVRKSLGIPVDLRTVGLPEWWSLNKPELEKVT